MRLPAAATRRVVALAVALSSVVVLVPPAAPAAVAKEELSDLEAKAQYAFFTEDLNALRGLARSNRALAESEVPLELYHYAHVQFRLLQLASRAKKAGKKEAEAAGAACVDALERANAKDARFAEGLALEADCHAYVAALGPVNAVTDGPKVAPRLEAAARVNPRNPRVLLSQAIASVTKDPNGDPKAAVAAFRQVTAAFDAPDASRPGEPTWGAAEAWLFLGRALERSGDVFAARDAYEKALLVAPEFVRARQRLAQLTRR